MQLLALVKTQKSTDISILPAFAMTKRYPSKHLIRYMGLCTSLFEVTEDVPYGTLKPLTPLVSWYKHDYGMDK